MSDSDIAIRIEGLGKRYKLGETLNTARNFRETLMTLPRQCGRMAKRVLKPKPGNRGTGTAISDHTPTTDELQGAHADPSHTLDPREHDGYFWVLKDINLEIKRGEAVGIIGRNGAGKSTLLKVLSRITQPTEGHAEIRGRVGALLEVGTGMHQELTGRENIYLNGAILGMRREEINRKFDEIVQFAGTEKFLDTPLKRYSSGMRVRLGFSVAAHLEPEILIVDEVLSVGDAEFRKKCLGKMDDVTGQGRTVILVSHNMSAVSNVCNTAIWLESGNVKGCWPTAEAISRYLAEGVGDQGIITKSDIGTISRLGSHKLLESIALLKADGKVSTQFSYGEDLSIRFTIRPGSLSESVNPVVQIRKEDGTLIAHSVCADARIDCPSSSLSQGSITFPNINLWPGTYLITVRIADVLHHKILEGWDNVLRFTVVHECPPRMLPTNLASVYLKSCWNFEY